MKKVYASLDIGTSTIKLVVGELINTNIQVLYANTIPSHGIKKGIIIDEEAVKQDIIKIITSAEQFLEAKIKNVLLNIPPNQCQIYSLTGSVQILASNHVIKEIDIEKAINKACRFEKKNNETLVSSVPIKYYYGEQSGYEAPIGKTSYSLQVDVLAITTTKKVLYPYIRVVEGAGIGIQYVTVSGYSAAKEVFDEAYFYEGAVLIDVGYRSSSIAYFNDGFLQYMTVCGVGGYDLTKAIALNWQIPMSKAETYKLKYGSCDIDMKEQDIILSLKNENEIINYTKYDLSMLLYEGVEEIMTKIKNKLSIIGTEKKYDIVIVGGGAEVSGFEQVASQILQQKVRTYRPQVVGARKMNLVSSLGLIYFLSDRNKIYGEAEPSIVLEDISNTMTLRLKGLTKADSSNTISDSKIKKIFDKFVAEE